MTHRLKRKVKDYLKEKDSDAFSIRTGRTAGTMDGVVDDGGSVTSKEPTVPIKLEREMAVEEDTVAQEITKPESPTKPASWLGSWRGKSALPTQIQAVEEPVIEAQGGNTGDMKEPVARGEAVLPSNGHADEPSQAISKSSSVRTENVEVYKADQEVLGTADTSKPVMDNSAETNGTSWFGTWRTKPTITAPERHRHPGQTETLEDVLTAAPSNSGSHPKPGSVDTSAVAQWEGYTVPPLETTKTTTYTNSEGAKPASWFGTWRSRPQIQTPADHDMSVPGVDLPTTDIDPEPAQIAPVPIATPESAPAEAPAEPPKVTAESWVTSWLWRQTRTDTPHAHDLESHATPPGTSSGPPQHASWWDFGAWWATPENYDLSEKQPSSSPPKAVGVPVNPLLRNLPETSESWTQFFRGYRPREGSGTRVDEEGNEVMDIPVLDEYGNPTSSPPPTMTMTPVKDSRSRAPSAPATPRIASPMPATAQVVQKKPSPPMADVRSRAASTASQKPPPPTVPPPPNHVLPDFDVCFPTPKPSRGLRRQISSMLHGGAQHSHGRPVRCAPPLGLKRAVCIGVHGYFPHPAVRSVLGQPTGTSVKFATMAAGAVQRWFDTNDPGTELHIEKIALEGEGLVHTRLETLWNLLLQHVDVVQNSDILYIAAHSQGSPVAIQLLARLIEEGYIRDGAKVGVLCMAGIHMGPFRELGEMYLTKTYNALERGAARELYEFQDTGGRVSRKYQEALRVVLASGAKMCLVGSLDDQLVPLYSAVFSHLSHPAIYRAVFVDGQIYAPFLARLIGFAMRMRNAGGKDHSLIMEISSALAGSLLGGKGHSRLYHEEAVYDLALRCTLETTTAAPVAPKVTPFHAEKRKENPFALPFAMRGIIDDPMVSREASFSEEVDKLRGEFEAWKPSTKPLKDLKYRLEPIQSTEDQG
ncbi:hypothetical protein YB2330_000295 [Saitoella coloradoensis]